MLATLQCFFLGHDYENAISKYIPVLDLAQYRVLVRQSVKCPRCHGIIDVKGSRPPVGIHHTWAFNRVSIINGDETMYYKAACWCDWSSRWFTDYNEMDTQRIRHERLEI